MLIRKDWFAVRMLLTATLGLSTFTACTGPNSSEKVLLGSWEHGDDPPDISEHQYSFNADHTFTLKGAKERDGKVEFTVTGTWSASPKILCIRFVSCKGPGCPSPQGIGVQGLGLSVCTPFMLSGRSLTIIDGRGSTNATQYEASTQWSRPNSFTAATPSSGPRPSDHALLELLVGRWTHKGDVPSTFTSEFSFSGDSSFTVIHTNVNDKGEEEESTGTGSWHVTDNRLCFQVTSSCTGRGCSPSPEVPVKDPFCAQFTLSGSTLTMEDSGESLRYIRQ